MINNSNVVNLSSKRPSSQNNRLVLSNSRRSGSRGSNFSRQRNSAFQSPSSLLLILQLILRLLQQLQNQNPPNPKPPEEPTPSPTDTLDLSADQRKEIQDYFGIFGEQNFSVIDKNGDNKLSAGDVVSISGGVTGGPIRDITVTQADVNAISGKDLADAKAALLENKAKWQNSRPESYSYTLQRSGFIGSDARKPVDITVNGDTVTDARFSDGSTAQVADFNRLTVDGLFDQIEQAIDRDAAEVRVEYDSQTGIPASIFIDQDKRIADEEVSLNASNFKAIENDTGIVGTNGADRINGTRGDDRISGLAGNDRIRGLQGEDFLFGNAGDDRIYGGGGDDTLSGGTENDYLSGDSGNNRLFGGQGSDVLASRSGSDFLDGGQGEDTARIWGNIDNYTIEIATIFPQPINPGDFVVQGGPSDNGFVLTNKETGQRISVVNIEKFRFNNIRLTADELRQRVTEQTQPPGLPLTKEQQKNALDLFGFVARGGERVQIIDQDRNGKISIGDIAKLDSQQQTLTEATVRQITDRPTGRLLTLNDNQKQNALDLFNTPVERARTHFVNIFDSNGDGKVSKGDIAIHKVSPSIVPLVLGYHTPETEVERTTLSEAQAASINGIATSDNQKVLDANRAKWENSGIENYSYEFKRTCFCSPDIIRPVDIQVKDGGVSNAVYNDDQQPLAEESESNKQSVNGLFDIIQESINNRRQVEVEYDAVTGMPQKIVIDRDLMPVDGGQTITATNLQQSGNETKLNLTSAQDAAIAQFFNHTPPPGTADGLAVTYTGDAIDRDGNGKLSVGDVVKLRQVGGIAGIDRITDRVLTIDDINGIANNIINNPSNNPLLDISNGISDKQKERLSKAVFPQNIAFAGNAPSLDQVIDNDNNGLLSVGDSIVVRRFNERSGQFDFSTQTLTQAQLDRYIAGESHILNTESDRLDLTKEQQAAIGARFNRKPPPNLVDAPTTQYTGIAIDKNGDNKLSVGDVVRLRSVGGFRLPDSNNSTRDQVLTAADIAFIEADRSHPLLDISKGLSNEQKFRLVNAINVAGITTGSNTISIGGVFDTNSDGKLSVGDYLQIQTTRIDVGNGFRGISFHRLTQTELDRYLGA